MYICTGCWNRNCRCGENRYVDIDDEIVEVVTMLNQKGYETRNCCAGHMEHAKGIPQPMTTYVQFYRTYQFPVIPQRFVLEKQETEDGYVHNVIRSISLEFDKINGYYVKDKSILLCQAQLENERLISIEELKEWANGLPVNNEKVV